LAKIAFGEPDATPFFEAAYPTRKWIKLCKACVDYIRGIYRRDTKQYLDRTGQEMTLANYFKSANYLGKILERPVPQNIKKLAKQLVRD
jgi:hypothetical protein